MGSRRLEFLGRIAATARRLRLKVPLDMLRDLADGLFLRLGYPPLSIEIDEIRFHGFLRHRSFLDQLASGSYEPATRRIFREAIPQADVFVDGGAHIGLYGLMAARYGRPGLAIIAIEPDPYNERALRYNVRRNGFGNFRIIPAAVSDSNGMEPILISDGSISSSLLLGRTNIGKTKSWIVRTMTMDSVLQDLPMQSLLVKLDIEGAEIMALKGMTDSLKRAERFIVICEINPSSLQAGSQTPAALIRSLQSTGGRVFFIAEKEDGLIPVTETFVTKGNLVCTRNWMVHEWRILP